MGLFSRMKVQMPGAGGGAAGTRRRRCRCRPALRAGHADRAAVPGGHRARPVRDGVLLGRRADVLAGSGVSSPRPSATRRATRRTRRTRRSAPPAPATTRSCGWCSTRRSSRYEQLLASVLGGPRPDAGHAPGQRRRHPVPLGDLHILGRAARRPPRRRATRSRSGSRGRLRPDHHRDRAAPGTSTTPRTTTSSTSRRCRTATAASAAPASACPVGLVDRLTGSRTLRTAPALR